MKNLSIFICLLFVSFATPCYSNPILVWVGEYLLGKAVDGVWDTATGAPDTRKLDTRLKDIETLLEGSLRQPIAALRDQITSSTTRAQYEAYVRTTLSSLEQRVAKNTEDIQRIQDRMTALESNQRGLQGDLKRYLEAGANVRPPPPVPQSRTVQTQVPFCRACGHYHWNPGPPCPRGPSTHAPCGTKHFPDQLCPATGTFVSRPNNPPMHGVCGKRHWRSDVCPKTGRQYTP